jgi:GNAT superfamily N-acetyltransferase
MIDRRRHRRRHDITANEALSFGGTAMTSWSFHPVTGERLKDMACFSEQHGKFRYCSCMRWRMRSTDFSRSTKENRVAALEQLVLDDKPIGVLAYKDGEPIGWCSVAPRESYHGLERHRALARIDDQPVWAVVCFFIDRRFRRRGLTLVLLKAAVAYARSQGAEIVEGYPVLPGSPSYTYMGSLSTFHSAGFRDVTPPGAPRSFMRCFFRTDRRPEAPHGNLS